MRQMKKRTLFHSACLVLVLSVSLTQIGCSSDPSPSLQQDASDVSDVSDAPDDTGMTSTDSGPSDTCPPSDTSTPSDSGPSDTRDSATSDVTSNTDSGNHSDTGVDTIEPDTVSTDTATDLCDQAPPLGDYPNWQQATDIRWPFGEDEDQTFANIFGTWPGSSSSGNLGILKGEYWSLPFTTGNLDASSKGQFNREGLAGTNDSPFIAPGPLIASFSRCPGDFDPTSPALASPGCLKSYGSPIFSISWGGLGSGRECELQSNTTYYFNVVYSDSDVGELPPNQATCSQDRPRCGHLWQAVGSE